MPQIILTYLTSMQCKIRKTQPKKKNPPHQKKREGNAHWDKTIQRQILPICTNGLTSWFTGARYGEGKPMETSVNVQYQSKQHIKYFQLLEKRNRTE